VLFRKNKRSKITIAGRSKLKREKRYFKSRLDCRQYRRKEQRIRKNNKDKESGKTMKSNSKVIKTSY
jgi:hypothetical protein